MLRTCTLCVAKAMAMGGMLAHKEMPMALSRARLQQARPQHITASSSGGGIEIPVSFNDGFNGAGSPSTSSFKLTYLEDKVPVAAVACFRRWREMHSFTDASKLFLKVMATKGYCKSKADAVSHGRGQLR